MFRVVDIEPDGAVSRTDEPDWVRPPEGATVRWIDLEGRDDAELELLRKRFDFHPLAIEDCRHFDQRPKLEEFRDCLFLVTQGFSRNEGDACTPNLHELHAFLGKNFLVTVHFESLAAVELALKRTETDPSLYRRGSSFLYYLIADRIVDDNLVVLDALAEEIEGVEEHIWATPERAELERLFEVRRSLVHMRRVLAPQREVIAILSKRTDPRIDESNALYFRDVYDHLIRIHEAIEVHRDLLTSAQEAYLSAVSNRTNEVMKYLTLMSAIFLPLSFLVGFFGQNFRDLPGLANWTESDPLMYAVLGVCAVTPFAMLGWFRHKRWL